MGYAKLLNNMTWSFSRIHCWESCPYSFYLRYIEERNGEQNYYAANGKVMHEIFEELLNGKISIDDAPSLYSDKYDEISEETKESTMEKTFELCMDYLCMVDPIDEERYEIIGVELELHFKIKKYKFIGFADLILRDKITEEIILIDHKSSDHFLKKDGKPLKNKLEDFVSYKHQMYLYCKGLKDEFGINVNRIAWHHFKDSGRITIIPFDESEYNESLQWAENTIAGIKKDRRFDCKKSFMRCVNLCDYRNDCEYKEEE